MRVRLLAVALLAVVVQAVCASSAFAGWESLFGLRPSRYAALAARHDLRDQVAVATADGYLTGADRATILAKAKRILKADEYQAFKQSLDRRWGPKRSHVSQATAQTTVRPAPTSASLSVGASAGLVVPASVLLPDN